MRVLLLEDHEPSATAVMAGLSRPDVGFDLRHSTTLAGGLKLLEKMPFDVALVDLGLPDANGTEAPLAIKSAAPALTVVVLTGADFEAVGEILVRQGVQDFLPKGETSLHRVTQVLRLAVERQRNEERLRKQASRDSLTKLPNRSEFWRVLHRAMCNAEREGTRVALLAIDIDNFKDINDSHGHVAGDEFLKNFSRRLQAVVRCGDCPARIGGDEFAVVLPNVGSVAEAGKLAETIRNRLDEPVAYNGSRSQVSASVGFAVYPDHARDGSRLLEIADQAMYRYKRSRPAKARGVTSEDERSSEQGSSENGLRT